LQLKVSQDEKNTTETIDSEGWLRTGDVAEIDSCGRVKIIDRIKVCHYLASCFARIYMFFYQNIMKLAQGEYVALEKIENLYSSSPIISQIYVHGDSLQSYLVAVIVPDSVQLANLASEVFGKKITQDSLEELSGAIADQRIQKGILSILSSEARRSGLKG
jgi:long-chain acyl-CoA synthetase